MCDDRQHWIRVTDDGDVDGDDDGDDDDDDDDDVDGDDEGEADGVDDDVDDFDDRVHATIAPTLEQDDAIIHRTMMTIAYITTPRGSATRDSFDKDDRRRAHIITGLHRTYPQHSIRHTCSYTFLTTLSLILASLLILISGH